MTKVDEHVKKVHAVHSPTGTIADEIRKNIRQT